MNYINIFQNSQTLSVSLGYTYSEDQLMHTFLDNFRKGLKYSAQIPSHQAELRIEETYTNQKYSTTSSLQNGYLNLDSSSGCGKIVIEKIFSIQSALFVEVLIIMQKNISKGSERKRRKLVRLVNQTTDVRNVCLVNVLDADMKTTYLKNV